MTEPPEGVNVGNPRIVIEFAAPDSVVSTIEFKACGVEHLLLAEDKIRSMREAIEYQNALRAMQRAKAQEEGKTPGGLQLPRPRLPRNLRM